MQTYFRAKVVKKLAFSLIVGQNCALLEPISLYVVKYNFSIIFVVLFVALFNLYAPLKEMVLNY